MKVGRHATLDRLARNERCIGALFTTYTFTPAFFEQHVLATVLRVTTDPDHDTAAYHDEVLAMLQETPVACFVDGTMAAPGQQLPYDLGVIRTRCFHPKVALLLYEGGARLSVGSGNLTEPGYSKNAESFFVRDLDYSDDGHAAILAEVARFFDAVHALAGAPGKATTEVLGALRRRLKAIPDGQGTDFAFIHTEGSSRLMDQILGFLPATAKITNIGVLAPFFERDDIDADDPDAAASVLVELSKRAGKNAELELGVLWENAPIARSAGAVKPIRDGLGDLWARRRGQTIEEQVIEYFTPTSEAKATYALMDQGGVSRKEAKEQLDDEVASGSAWWIGRPQVFAPASLIATATKTVASVRTLLFPTPQLVEAQVIDRPLHAKMFRITFKTGSKIRTLVVVGSANASRRALLQTPEQGGNIEACVAFVVDGEVTLSELSPDLRACHAPIDWRERTFVPPPALPSIPLIATAIHDARLDTLVITWVADELRQLGGWVVRYQDVELLRSSGTPTTPVALQSFRLAASCCELVVAAADGERTFPIIVEDLTALPVGSSARTLTLRDLLALITYRLTPARRGAILAEHGHQMLEATLTAILGDSFTPTDVLQAWWKVCASLVEEGVTVAGLKRRLLGYGGASTIWDRLLELAGQVDGMRVEEVWFYGVELRRELQGVVIPENPDHAEKVAIVDAYVEKLRHDLKVISPDGDGKPWLAKIVGFYAAGVV